MKSNLKTTRLPRLMPWQTAVTSVAAACLFLSSAAAQAEVDFLQRYPTTLTAGDANPRQARAWEFTEHDVFRVSRFDLAVGQNLRVEVGPAEVGIGHCADGAVWAVVIPRAGGTLTSSASHQQEGIGHVWLRFHPREINRLFPPETVSGDGAGGMAARMQVIANAKMTSSWQAGGKALIPEPKDMTVDIDTTNGTRRFFVVNQEAHTAEYVGAFENRALRRPPTLTQQLARDTFDQLWEAFDQKYAMFALRPEVDWARMREQYRPKALASQSTEEFAGVCAEMLKNLRDLHVWLTLSDESVPVFNRPRTANANPQAWRGILGGGQQSGRVMWAVTTNHIGFIAILGLDDPKIPAQCDEALEQMRDTRGLIVDARLNGGGSEPLGGKFAGRFLEKEFVYAYSQFRNGPSHANLAEKKARSIAPRGPWRYNRPVTLLIGQKCMSSAESFVGMMTGDPQVTTMGDHTCGSSGNPEIIRLPLDMTVSVPRWIDYLPDGTPLDERGFQPKIAFQPSAGAFEGTRDDLLTAALERLSHAPLPAKPIERPAFERSTAELPDHGRAVEEEAKDAARPKVVSVTPTNGASAVQAVNELNVRFDRPMDPLALKLDWESGGFLDCEFPKYDSNKYEFTIPVRLSSGVPQQIVVNKPQAGEEPRKWYPGDGFQSVDHHLAGIYVWRFRTQGMTASEQAMPPRATNISPAPGSQVPYRTFLEIQFDQPMLAPGDSFPRLMSESAGMKPQVFTCIQYEAAAHTFRIPLLLPPGKKAGFTLTGFQSAAGALAKAINLEYQVSDEELAKAVRERMEAGAKDPRLLELLETMRQKRAQLTSLAERVQDLQLMQKDGLFAHLQSEKAVFKWQKPDQFFADATGLDITCNDFRIGSDGQNWWQHFESPIAKRSAFEVCPATEARELNMLICDPFGLRDQTPAAAAAKLGLSYAGVSNKEAVDCVMVEHWEIDNKTIPEQPFGSLVRSWIDAQNGRPTEITLFFDGGELRRRFRYDAVNEPLLAMDFGVPKVDDRLPTSPEALDTNYTHRFIKLHDGSDGKISARWGKKGPKGTRAGGID